MIRSVHGVSFSPSGTKPVHIRHLKDGDEVYLIWKGISEMTTGGKISYAIFIVLFFCGAELIYYLAMKALNYLGLGDLSSSLFCRFGFWSCVMPTYATFLAWCIGDPEKERKDRGGQVLTDFRWENERRRARGAAATAAAAAAAGDQQQGADEEERLPPRRRRRMQRQQPTHVLVPVEQFEHLEQRFG